MASFRFYDKTPNSDKPIAFYDLHDNPSLPEVEITLSDNEEIVGVYGTYHKTHSFFNSFGFVVKVKEPIIVTP